jgi:hypothetical protein
MQEQFQDFSIINMTNLNDYQVSINSLDDYKYHRMAHLLCAIGYLCFALISSMTFLTSYKNPIELTKNILFCVAFFGISSVYFEKFLAKHVTGTHEVLTNFYEFFVFNIMLVIYGLLAILYTTKYHIYSFYKSPVKRFSIFGIEIDGLLFVLCHALLLLSVLTTKHFKLPIFLLAIVLLLCSYGLVLFTNYLKSDSMKNKLLYNIINFASLALLIGYSTELLMFWKEKLV